MVQRTRNTIRKKLLDSGKKERGRGVGVFRLSGFFGRFVGGPELPLCGAVWLLIPVDVLASA